MINIFHLKTHVILKLFLKILHFSTSKQIQLKTLKDKLNFLVW